MGQTEKKNKTNPNINSLWLISLLIIRNQNKDLNLLNNRKIEIQRL